MNGKRSLRLFVAVQAPADVRAAIKSVIQELRETGPSVKWEPPEKLHATLKFLGSTPEPKVPGVIQALSTIATPLQAMPVRYSGIGSFPEQRQPRVIWIGLEDPEEALARLHSSIEGSMALLGFERDERPFRPHLTIGRTKGSKDINRLRAKMESITFKSEQVLLHELELVKSDLTPRGSVYTVLERFRFGNSEV